MSTARTIGLMFLVPLVMPFFVLCAACVLTDQWLRQNWRTR